MSLFIPVGILLVFALIVIILGRIRFTLIQSWIVSLVAAVLAWSSFFVIKLTGIINWSSSYANVVGLQGVLVRFQLTERNWIFGILLISFLIALLFNESNLINDKNNSEKWSGYLIITALGLMAIMAGSLLAFIFSSTLLDIGVLTFRLILQKTTDQKNTPVLSFIFRSVGTFLILFGMASVGNENLFLICVGAMFRIGDFSSFMDENVEISPKNGQMVFTDLVVPISLLAYFYGNEISISAFTGKNFLITLWSILGVVLLIKGYSSKEELLKHKAWSDTFAWLGFFLILNGSTSAIIPFTMVFISLWGLMNFSIQRRRGIGIGIFILGLGLIGFPYTPSYGLWLLVGQHKPGIYFVIYDLFLVFLLFTAFNKLTFEETKEKSKEDWVGIVSTSSLVFLLIVDWFLELWLKQISINQIEFVLPVLFLILFTSSFVVGKINRIKRIILRLKSTYGLRFQHVMHWLVILFNFKWVLNFFSLINKIISEVVNLFTRVLDGEGGLLWAFVFLILLSTVLMVNRIP